MNVHFIVWKEGTDLVALPMNRKHGIGQPRRLTGQAERIGSNPYALYGDIAAEFCGFANWQSGNLSITVSTMSSGSYPLL